ncbi:MAG: 1-(5-phosphoribosyl)-5-[(5-phosphoribosylamino)methylideneamino]imidazole-4-carboxamide isomerase [Clostridiales Family XIII bacterium]|jgi:phosphoribosylformimino-5-aminoimidazole carboxamide ribotide isomerase|nr:1-(5-phosphoribosyl)-5-[(5-phosphoribosylamino)methylideneamino]imidazole-4-carboxamide isomerase [Clostridiales Family XIII bacterium]
MVILPAIDIKDGICVRLTRGDFHTAEQVAADPLETALRFRGAGAEWIHMVDLDGALQGRRVNAEIFTRVAKKSGLKVELGGGIRDMDAAAHYLENGVSRVILGSAALQDPAFTQAAVRRFGARVAVGIDAVDGRVRTSGWLAEGDADYIELAGKMEAMGVQTLIFTDISKDGTLSGPNFGQLAALRRATGCDIIASGGVSTMDDVKKLKEMGLYGAILGKAAYKGTLVLRDAIEWAARDGAGGCLKG